jgi:hypothetical protein
MDTVRHPMELGNFHADLRYITVILYITFWYTWQLSIVHRDIQSFALGSRITKGKITMKLDAIIAIVRCTSPLFNSKPKLRVAPQNAIHQMGQYMHRLLYTSKGQYQYCPFPSPVLYGQLLNTSKWTRRQSKSTLFPLIPVWVRNHVHHHFLWRVFPVAKSCEINLKEK